MWVEGLPRPCLAWTSYTVAERVVYWCSLLADDFACVSTGDRLCGALTTLLLVSELLRAPLSWHKVRGGSAIKWIGYDILLPSPPSRSPPTKRLW